MKGLFYFPRNVIDTPFPPFNVPVIWHKRCDIRLQVLCGHFCRLFSKILRTVPIRKKNIGRSRLLKLISSRLIKARAMMICINRTTKVSSTQVLTKKGEVRKWLLKIKSGPDRQSRMASSRLCLHFLALFG